MHIHTPMAKCTCLIDYRCFTCLARPQVMVGSEPRQTLVLVMIGSRRVSLVFRVELIG